MDLLTQINGGIKVANQVAMKVHGYSKRDVEFHFAQGEHGKHALFIRQVCILLIRDLCIKLCGGLEG